MLWQPSARPNPCQHPWRKPNDHEGRLLATLQSRLSQSILHLQDFWSQGSPSRRRASAGMISPSLMLTMSPGTKTAASSSLHLPFRRTLAFGASRAMRAAAALPALFSSMKLIVELIMSSTMMPTKSW
ncbi:unnamed protein product [Linum tenue]|uniref:Uncharacterized protein n=1 Tax=Linum tenue TaxID=586396 RepID=A0AAV0JD97_9ROSI|nr:unnamed protein product [Linum tenue]